MADQPLTLLNDVREDAVCRALKRHAATHGPHSMAHCVDRACQVATAIMNRDQEPAPFTWDGCRHAAVIVFKDRRVWYPCRSHEGSRPGKTMHHFAAHWPACPAPWCRLPYSHYAEGTMHDIPPGRAEYHDATGVRADA